MSQIIASVASTPSVPTSFVTDSGTATPIANVLNIAAYDSSINADNGILSQGAGNNVDIILTNRMTGSASSVNAASANLLAFNMAAAGTYTIYYDVLGYEPTTPGGCNYKIETEVVSTGAALIVIDTDFRENESPALAAADWTLTALGTTLTLAVTGVAGLTVRYNVLATYRYVS